MGVNRARPGPPMLTLESGRHHTAVQLKVRNFPRQNSFMCFMLLLSSHQRTRVTTTNQSTTSKCIWYRADMEHTSHILGHMAPLGGGLWWGIRGFGLTWFALHLLAINHVHGR